MSDVGFCSPEEFAMWQKFSQKHNAKYNELLRKVADYRERGDKAGQVAAEKEAHSHWFGSDLEIER